MCIAQAVVRCNISYVAYDIFRPALKGKCFLNVLKYFLLICSQNLREPCYACAYFSFIFVLEVYCLLVSDR